MAAGLLRVVVAPSAGSVPAGAGTKEAGTSDGQSPEPASSRLRGCRAIPRLPIESEVFRHELSRSSSAAPWRRGATLSLLARSDIELLRGFRVRVMTHLTGERLKSFGLSSFAFILEV